MDSKRRMVELHVWDKPFFSELSQTEKLFYWFMICKCDNVGVYQHNAKLAAFHCDGEIDLQAFIDTVNADEENITIINNGLIWIKDFVRETWGTLSAGNNLGRSCYKLLHKHGLLERFISEYPNCIKIKSFRDKITEGKLDLPLPQGSPRPDPENKEYEEYEGEGSPRPATININNSNSINEGINGNKAISNTNANIYETIKKNIGGLALVDVGSLTFQKDVDLMLEELSESDVKDPAQYLIEKMQKVDWMDTSWDEFTEQILSVEETPF
ncbi:hypothetical protein [Fodinibius halophilus]|uniref:Uncharacterized protein n=1 Tax=Fodinibius halophilus TaxID=1736908 RepID=A0A6M1TIY4_9BACT|nr:hypothetical protein [Fodinibius halophilus]NGP90012.1 hypothetical protein [Fodinibius halophilus]